MVQQYKAVVTVDGREELVVTSPMREEALSGALSLLSKIPIVKDAKNPKLEEYLSEIVIEIQDA